jgi:hypothetical protein
LAIGLQFTCTRRQLDCIKEQYFVILRHVRLFWLRGNVYVERLESEGRFRLVEVRIENFVEGAEGARGAVGGKEGAKCE